MWPLSRCERRRHPAGQACAAELNALLAQIESLVAEGDRARFDSDDRYRGVLHRLWIAVGNEAIAYVRLAGFNPYAAQPWALLYRLRNILAYDRLPDIDEVWRMTTIRPAQLHEQVHDLL